MPAWMQNAANQNAAAAAFRGFSGGGANVELDATKLNIKWRQGGGTQMQKGGFGYVYIGASLPTPHAPYPTPHIPHPTLGRELKAACACAMCDTSWYMQACHIACANCHGK